MKKAELLLTAEIARQHFSYDPQTGVVKRLPKGKAMTSKDCDGYIVIKHKGYPFIAHRLAWLLHYGEWPKLSINHINGVKDDNRIANLEDVSLSENVRHAHATGLVRNLGTGNGRARLTEADALAIRFGPGAAKALAKKYGMCASYIAAIRGGRAWKHLPMTPPGESA